MPKAAESEPLNILVVEDDDADAMMIEEALVGAAAQTVLNRVADGQEAMNYLRRADGYATVPRPDLILLDLNMPRMGGLQTLEKIKSDEGLRTIPVVVLTTSDADLDIWSSYDRHANAFVTKPMTLDEFAVAVQRISAFYAETAELPRQ